MFSAGPRGEAVTLPRGPREESPSLSYLACSLLVSPNQRPEGLRDEIHPGQPPRTQEVDNGGQSQQKILKTLHC